MNHTSRTMAELPDEIFQFVRVKQDLARVKHQLATLRKRIARETIHTQAAVWYDLIATAYDEMLQIDKAQDARELRDHYVNESQERGVPALRELNKPPKKTGRSNSDVEKPGRVDVRRGETRLPASA